MELDEYRASLDAWLEQNLSALQPDHAGLGSLDDQMEQLAKVKRLTFEAGWMRWGWPERSVAWAAPSCCGATSVKR